MRTVPFWLMILAAAPGTALGQTPFDQLLSGIPDSAMQARWRDLRKDGRLPAGFPQAPQPVQNPAPRLKLGDTAQARDSTPIFPAGLRAGVQVSGDRRLNGSFRGRLRVTG